ncbi:unnamed protein product [marine sediment metagenome]|uniref:Uncharacterized protein n=1 Tax=marine sediment metagenome TaxID=412755 RepID=X1BVY7_9ZZZZ
MNVGMRVINRDKIMPLNTNNLLVTNFSFNKYTIGIYRNEHVIIGGKINT